MPEGKEAEQSKEQAKGWGKQNYPFPKGVAFIQCDEMNCVGCGICQMACSMHHFGVINKDLSRIQVYKYPIPISKGIQVTCTQCQEEERECQKACPLDPPVIYYDNESLHMVIDEERCLGEKCLRCAKACPADAIRIYPSVSPNPFVCDLCDTENNGNRNPQCVNVCPTGCLHFKDWGFFNFPARDFMRKHADEKAELIAKRLYPLSKDSMWQPEWRS
ncbi:4Fe-4S dicluster domain-containing protein [Chloroflexota bacterium]